MKSEQIIIDVGVVKDWNWIKYKGRETYYKLRRWLRNWLDQFSPSRIWRLICIKRKMDDIRYCENLIREHMCKMRMYGVPTEDIEKAFDELNRSIRGEKNKS